MQPCPRQLQEATLPSQFAHKSHWREDDGKCSYCGSLSPRQFFQAIEEGGELTPTDKNYKVYIRRKNPDVGKLRVTGISNFEQDGWLLVTPENVRELPRLHGQIQDHLIGSWVNIDPEPEMREDKFYFQHLTADECLEFVKLLNEKKLKIGYPGYFYRLPFFIQRVK